jgi:hypothetical protein
MTHISDDCVANEIFHDKKYIGWYAKRQTLDEVLLNFNVSATEQYMNTSNYHGMNSCVTNCMY